MTKPREVELAVAARADIVELLNFSMERFGTISRRRYEVLIDTALEDLRADPVRIGSVDRPQLGAGTRTYHLRHSQKRARTTDGVVGTPRHILVYEWPRPELVLILRVLHDSMDPERHLPRTESGGPG